MPQVIERNCDTCGNPIEAVMASLGFINHPSCDPVPQDGPMIEPPVEPMPVQITPMPGKAMVPAPQIAKAIKDEFTSVLLWFENSRPRSKQANIGPSQLGTECDRQLAYKVAGLTGPNEHGADPWPAFVGSSIHTRVEEAFDKYQQAHPHALKWLMEQWVQADPQIRGKADFHRDEILLDLKSAGKDKMDEVAKQGPELRYRVQANIYAKGLRDAGKPIKWIVIVYVPRAGWLKDMFVWAEPYDEALALEYIGRPYRLGQKIMELDILNNPHRWEQIEAKPHYNTCKYCPMYDKYVPSELGATDKGCPGYQGGKK